MIKKSIEYPIKPSAMTEQQRQFADAYYPELARISKAMASPARLELLDLLRQGERCVETLAEEAGMSVANASQHLKQLKAARLIESDKRGQRVFYRVANQDVCRFFCDLRGLAENQLSEMAQVRRMVADEDTVPNEELLARVANGQAVLLDVRPEEEFDAGHLEGALSIPLTDLKARVHELPANMQIVVYCRGIYCTLAREAVRLLRKVGFEAHRLPLAVMELRSREWRLERPPSRQAKARSVSRAPASTKKAKKKTPSSSPTKAPGKGTKTSKRSKKS